METTPDGLRVAVELDLDGGVRKDITNSDIFKMPSSDEDLTRDIGAETHGDAGTGFWLGFVLPIILIIDH